MSLSVWKNIISPERDYFKQQIMDQGVKVKRAGLPKAKVRWRPKKELLGPESSKFNKKYLNLILHENKTSNFMKKQKNCSSNSVSIP